LITGLKPDWVVVDGHPLPRSDNPVRRESGWWWDQAHQRVYLTVPHEKKSVDIEIYL